MSRVIDDPLLSVVIPVYNEENFVEALVRRVAEQPWRMEILAIDDGSTDDTPSRLQALAEELDNLRLFRHERNAGKGAALRTGFAEVQGDVVIVQDADLEYDPREYGVLLGPILDGRADVVYGSRFLGGPHRVHNFHHYVANRGLTTLSNVLTNLNLTDMETCYKVCRREVLEQLDLRSNGFGFDPEFTAQVAALGCRVYEVPISYSGRDYSEGKKIGWKDAVVSLGVIFTAKLRRRRRD
jgi:glycosyltransferase involved in cell wall biosynthesis